MMMIEPFGGELLTQLLVHLGFVLTALAFLVREILWLRLTAILANLCVGYAAFRMPEPSWPIIAWTAAFIAINTGHSIWLVYERHLMRLSEDEQRLRESAFAALDLVCVKRLLRCGSWRTFQAKETLVHQGVHLDRLIVIATGEAAVLLGGRVVSRLSTGKFVGEISYLSGETSTASVVATEPTRCLVWQKDALHKLLKRRPELVSVIHAAIGKDLAAKTAAHNLLLSQV